MNINKVPKDALFGIFYVRKPLGDMYDSYYDTLHALAPLFRSNELRQRIVGFYVNHISETIGGHIEETVRISYFVQKSDVSSAVTLFSEFFNNKALTCVKEQHPLPLIVARNYGGESFEERFRSYLNLQTQIGLELIERDLLQAQRLFATYRWQIRRACLQHRPHFEPTFERDSPTYNSLSTEAQNQFLDDLGEWPNPPQVDWAHMMVNLVLGADWMWAFGHPNYLIPGRPCPVEIINMLVNDLGFKFQIPPDWRP